MGASQMTNQSTSAFSSIGSSTNKVVALAGPVRLLINENVSPWGDKITERLEHLIRLDHGWDGYQARPVSFVNASFALQMLNNICGVETPAPQIVPGVSGDLQIEWHTLQGDLELHVKGPNNVHAWRAMANGDSDGMEMDFTNDFAVVAQWVREVTEPPIAAAAAA
jgi:hypothetical protein